VVSVVKPTSVPPFLRVLLGILAIVSFLVVWIALWQHQREAGAGQAQLGSEIGWPGVIVVVVLAAAVVGLLLARRH